MDGWIGEGVEQPGLVGNPVKGGSGTILPDCPIVWFFCWAIYLNHSIILYFIIPSRKPVGRWQTVVVIVLVSSVCDAALSCDSRSQVVIEPIIPEQVEQRSSRLP